MEEEQSQPFDFVVLDPASVPVWVLMTRRLNTWSIPQRVWFLSIERQNVAQTYKGLEPNRHLVWGQPVDTWPLTPQSMERGESQYRIHH